MLYGFSSLVLLLIGLGFWQRRHRRRHITLMVSAFTLDFLLVLAVEIQRHAIEKIAAHQVGAFTLFHAGVSTTVLILYGVMAYLGYGIIQNRPGVRERHRWLGVVFVVLRLTNYVTSFYVV